ncbi:MAG: energy transducer TonB [Acidobacteria bacterium]|nr:energy transducer TonB [Acidobacteriota bacterium]
MSQRGKFLRAFACALAISANGAGALAQEQRMQRVPPPPPPHGEPPPGSPRIMISQMPGAEIPMQQGGVVMGAPGEYSFTFVSSEMAFDSRVVKGAPFSAEAVTESTQTLGDGNRITRMTISRLYRDSEGRTRREQTLNGIGSWAASAAAPPTIFINDPVAGANYVLSPKTHTAQKSSQLFFKQPEGGEQPSVRLGGTSVVATAQPRKTEIRGGVLNGKADKRVQPVYPAVARAAGATGAVEVEVTVDEGGNVASARAVSGHPLLQQAAVDAARQWTFKPTTLKGEPVKVAGIITFSFMLSGKESDEFAAGAAAQQSQMKMRTRAPGNPPEPPKFPETRESLGKQTIEGVEAEGTRTTVTIPAGAIGNERAIQIVSERWYSQELQTVLMTKHSDPRFGETTYRLTNVSRTEPDHSLFEVPAGFEVMPPPPPGGMLMRTKQRDQ